MEFNERTPFNSYLIGLLQTDGNIYETTRNRGRITLELSEKDSDIIEKINNIIPEYSKIYRRTRNTNFKQNSQSISLKIFDMEMRNHLKKFIPVGNKNKTINIPDNIIEIDYWRGIIDGDGSLGLTSKNIPFISLVTKSSDLAISFINFIKNITGVIKTSTPNKRDDIYNIMLTKELAQCLVKTLYYDNCICIDRKKEKAVIVLSWNRPDNMKKITWNKKRWNNDEDDYILTHSIEDSITSLNRNENSIKIRLSRLNQIH